MEDSEGERPVLCTATDTGPNMPLVTEPLIPCAQPDAALTKLCAFAKWLPIKGRPVVINHDLLEVHRKATDAGQPRAAAHELAGVGTAIEQRQWHVARLHHCHRAVPYVVNPTRHFVSVFVHLPGRHMGPAPRFSNGPLHFQALATSPRTHLRAALLAHQSPCSARLCVHVPRERMASDVQEVSDVIVCAAAGSLPAVLFQPSPPPALRHVAC